MRDDGIDRGHAAGEHAGRDTAFESSEILLQPRARGIRDAGIFVSLVLADSLLHVGRGGINGDRDGAGQRIGFLSGVNGAGGEAESLGCFPVWFHFWESGDPGTPPLCRSIGISELAGNREKVYVQQSAYGQNLDSATLTGSRKTQVLSNQCLILKNACKILSLRGLRLLPRLKQILRTPSGSLKFGIAVKYI